MDSHCTFAVIPPLTRRGTHKISASPSALTAANPSGHRFNAVLVVVHQDAVPNAGKMAVERCT